jgi:hypothetical protein
MTSSTKSRAIPAAVVACLLLCVVLSGCRQSGENAAPDFEATFEGSSTDLEHTQVVATLNEPLVDGKNTVWSASFQAAWKRLQEDLAKGPVKLKDGPAIVDALNRAEDPKDSTPADNLYVAAGRVSNGIVERIRTEVVKKFPGKTPPDFGKTEPLEAVAYCYLQVNLRYGTSYIQSESPLKFTSADGKTTEVHSFGIRPSDHVRDHKLLDQPAVLFKHRDEDDRVEFAVDLDRNSESNQIVIAVVEPGASLAETLASVETKIEQYGEEKEPENVGGSRLIVPDMAWKLSHRYTELIDKFFQNKGMEELFIGEALQDIDFRMDRSGARLSSEARISVEKSKMLKKPIEFIANRPFLLYMKQRDADKPYFVMWIDNAELLRTW